MCRRSRLVLALPAILLSLLGAASFVRRARFARLLDVKAFAAAEAVTTTTARTMTIATATLKPPTSTSPATAMNNSRHKPVDANRKNVYMLGNSVTRHYGFEICELAKSGKSNQTQVLDRKQEQKLCRGILGTSSCELYCGSTAVRFLWKNTLSLSASADGRDACKGQLPSSTSTCLGTQLNGAQSMDLLVVGSVAANDSYMIARGWRDGRPQIADFLPRWEEALNHTNFPQLLRMLHDVFPGLIIWQSYPFVLRERDSHRRLLREHVETIHRMNARTEKAIKSFQEGYASACDARILFDDFWPLQVKHANMYQDVIHHPGPLSNIIVQQIMDQWTHHARVCE
ncbi:unnamed protein product [Symbiodinium sp. CCMP2456]|nr:unnamed protein product [Symbiodinium sp. CCMP2456]